jgi:hypothetical protein
MRLEEDSVEVLKTLLPAVDSRSRNKKYLFVFLPHRYVYGALAFDSPASFQINLWSALVGLDISRMKIEWRSNVQLMLFACVFS